MKDAKITISSVITGLLVTILLCALIVTKLLVDGDNSTSSFWEFISDIQNFAFLFHYATVFICSWLIKGYNNKIFLVMWVLGLSLYYFIYFQFQNLFLFGDKNIYAFSWSGTFSVFALMLACYLRKPITRKGLVLLTYSGIASDKIARLVKDLTTTHFELRMRRILGYFFVWEFVFGVGIISYAIAMGVPANGSILNTMALNEHPEPFSFYYGVEALFAFVLSFCILRNTYIDFNNPDDDKFYLTEEERAEILTEFKKLRRKEVGSGH